MRPWGVVYNDCRVSTLACLEGTFLKIFDCILLENRVKVSREGYFACHFLLRPTLERVFGVVLFMIAHGDLGLHTGSFGSQRMIVNEYSSKSFTFCTYFVFVYSSDQGLSQQC